MPTKPTEPRFVGNVGYLIGCVKKSQTNHELA